MLKPTLLALTLVSSGAPLWAAPHTPVKGSPQRTAIMNALHRAIGVKYKPLVTARTFNVQNGWAFVQGGWDRKDGKPLPEENQEGPGTNFDAVLHRERGSWKVKWFGYVGDVENDEHARRFPQAPHAIFKSSAG